MARAVRAVVLAAENFRLRAARTVLGVGSTEVSALFFLFTEGTSTPTELAARLQITTASVTELVERLGRTGLARVAVDREKRDVHARVFCPAVGVVEDPATGSAGVALGVFLGARGVLPDGSSTVTVAQGAEIGRPSRLEVQVRMNGGTVAETAVRGGVRMVAKGELLALPEV